MSRHRLTLAAAFGAAVLAAAAGAACRNEAEPPSRYEGARALFENPPAEYGSAPLWVWNDRMTEAQVRGQLADFKARGIGGVFIHPRPGLITPYLSEEWLSLCRLAVDTGRELGLKIWLYDENSYPSGFAGGHVPARMPDAVRAGLRMIKADTLPGTFETPPLLILQNTPAGQRIITEEALRGETDDTAGPYRIFEAVRQPPSPWHGGFAYVDVMRPDVTRAFLEITLDAYKRTFGGEFGRTVPGVFQDEAEISPAGGRDAVNYTPRLFDAFQARWGYDLRMSLPSLYEERGDWRKVRHDYSATLLDLFIEGWAEPYYRYCEENGLAFTGHYWEHEWPRPRVGPDNLAMAAFAHMPGIDILMNEFATDPHAQFGNARAVKEIRSAANQGGRKRTLSETYGAGGWDMTFADQKRIGDWEYALGVNFLNQHLSYATIKGARKRDHPLSFSAVEPWWPAYGILAGYFARLSAALSFGEQVNRVLVLEPTTTAWMYYAPGAESEILKGIGADFQRFVDALEAAQIEYDLVSERTLRDMARARYRTLTVGERDYDLLILPPGLNNLDMSTWKLLTSYIVRHGRVLSWVPPPAFIDGLRSDEPKELSVSFGDRWFLPGAGFGRIAELVPPGIAFEDLAGTDLLFHHRREFDDGQLVFLANTDPAQAVSGRFETRGGGVEEWNPFTGAVTPCPFERAGRDRVAVEFEIPPGGSLLLGIPMRAAEPARAVERSWRELEGGPVAVERAGPNVLTLDFCDVTIAGSTERNLYFYDAQRKTFQAHGLERNPWDSAVQFETNIIDRNDFPADSGFAADFRFRADAGEHLGSLRAVVERPELFRVSINGREVKPMAGEWWLDPDFGVFPIGEHVRPGPNTVEVAAGPFSIFAELEPIYIRGDFALRSETPGFRIVPPRPLAMGAWSGQGLPFYGAYVAYRRVFDIGGEALPERAVVRLGGWRGATAEVRVNGSPAGTIVGAPYEVDVTALLKPGSNDIEVAVCGTLKNTLGPHHNDPPLGRAWPSMFQAGPKSGGPPPGAAYDVVGYGLFEPFTLRVSESRRGPSEGKSE